MGAPSARLLRRSSHVAGLGVAGGFRLRFDRAHDIAQKRVGALMGPPDGSRGWGVKRPVGNIAGSGRTKIYFSKVQRKIRHNMH